MTPRRSRGEAGLTLVEVLVAVTIIALAIPTIVSALGTASLASNHHRDQVDADTVIRSYAEAIKEQVHLGGYTACAASYTVPASYSLQVPAGYSAPVMDPSQPTQYWHKPNGGFAGGFSTTCSTTAATCASANTCDDGVQRLSLVEASADGRDNQTLQLILRQP